MTPTGTEYFRRVLSPWAPGVDNPLPGWVDRCAREAPDAGSALAVDVGCGPGVLTCYLAQRYGRVVAVDRDPQMVEATSELVEKLRARGAPFGEVELRCADWAECGDLSRSASLVCAVNSILEPEPGARQRLLAGLRDALTPGRGRILAVFPAMEAQVHLVEIFAAELAARGLDDEEVAAWLDRELAVGHSFDALLGTFASHGEPAQKFFYELELRWELADADLEVEALARVTYPWEVCRQVDAGYFPGEVELFDWFVAGKPQTT